MSLCCWVSLSHCIGVVCVAFQSIYSDIVITLNYVILNEGKKNKI